MKFRSAWDAYTWGILGLLGACCAGSVILDDDPVPFIVCLVMLVFAIVTFFGIYYRIDDRRLIVYRLFIPKAYPIDEISAIRSTETTTAAPAASLKHRLAIYFVNTPDAEGLIISPVRKEEFVARLLAVKPDINV